jgi:hypothetical protein
MQVYAALGVLRDVLRGEATCYALESAANELELLFKLHLQVDAALGQLREGRDMLCLKSLLCATWRSDMLCFRICC